MIGLPEAAAIVHEEAERILHGREQARDLLRQRRQLIGRRPLGRQARGADLENPARFVHLLAGEAVQRGEEAQRLAAERRRPVGDVRPRSVARLNDAHRGERAKPGPHRRPAHADTGGKIALGRQAVARPERAALDQRADVRHDLLGAAFAGRVACGHESPCVPSRPVSPKPRRRRTGRSIQRLTVTTTGVRSRAAHASR
jgi:hypothetical protein